MQNLSGILKHLSCSLSKSAVRFSLLILVSLCCFSIAFGQWDERNAKEFFKRTNYLMAIEEYKNGLKIEPDKFDYNYHLGLCYLRTNIDKTAAAGYLQKAYDSPKSNTELPYYLGKAYLLNLEFDKAKMYLDQYLAKPGKNLVDAALLRANCNQAIELIKAPINISFKNMGKRINSEFPDYNPFVTKDERVFLFTSRRETGKGNIEFDGYYPSDIYEVRFNGRNFSGAKNIGSVNTALDEEIVGIHDDGSKMYVYLDHNLGRKDDPYGDIYMSTKKGNSWQRRTLLEDGVNTSHMEISCSRSTDGKTLIFSSNRPRGKGGYDIYMTRKLPNGNWGNTQNVESLNTAGDEEYPSLSPDGKTLYFSSNGHYGMGGMDLYKVIWNHEDNTWGAPENLGYPLNTPDDEKTICFPSDYKHAYISACREGGFGDLDIYRVTFNDVLLNPALYQTTILDELTSEKIMNGQITVFNDQSDRIGVFKPNKNNGVFTITLDPGTYSVDIEMPGYPLKNITWNVSEFDYKEELIKKSIKISKLQ